MTEKLFYRDPYLRETRAKVLHVEKLGDRVRLLLDRTIFYPEGGGQPSDRGFIEGNGFRVLVDRVYGKDKIWHEGKLEGRFPEKGDEVRLTLDWEWRYENMRAHTGQHILSAVIKGLLGADTTGFQIFPEHGKIEIDYPGELSWELVNEIERKTNEIIWGDVEVEVEVYEELPGELSERLRKPLSEKVKPPIRIVKIGTVDVTPCGGTHVRSTREVGVLKVLNFYRKSRKLWRIEFATGNRALRALNEILKDYWGSLEEMPNKNRPLRERVIELRSELEKLEEEKSKLRRELWRWKAEALIKNARKIDGVRVITLVEEWPMKDAQAFAIYLVEHNPGTVVLIAGENYVVFAKSEKLDVSMRSLLRAVLAEVGGGGGGSDNLAKGGGFRVSPREVLDIAVKKLGELL
ncbi:alanyl-tRNA editing protein [Thermococcus gammatolerans]|uniref:Alanyl-tRNA synthetase-related protein (C-terminus) n=1 Tax=Thermococcus gammatolerans (strain DSM 15229 / JCM 11827 / EJ3) TaxID=593117 RepID=C5A339_THEGJ|nr:DHHA1 domain-containing protein [Thermococcus gammatolerans]ACS32651.1 Alanyl-tRNA synthetase-related protein (C-terminus) [Thermococcus gammatolerans EJ3]